MHKACLPGSTAPFTHPGSTSAPGALDAPPAKLPVRTHEAQIVDGNIMIIESDEAPNLPPGLTPAGHV